MVKIPLGFVKDRNSTVEKGEEEKIVLHGIDAEFDKMVSVLQLEKKQLVKDLKLEKKIKKELVRIHKQIQKLGQEIQKRQTLLAQVYAIQKDNPKRALELLVEIDRIDDDLEPKFKLLYDQLEKHALVELSLLYKGVDLSKEEVIAIRGIANTMSVRLTQLKNQVTKSEKDNIRQNIISQNPSLK